MKKPVASPHRMRVLANKRLWVKIGKSLAVLAMVFGIIAPSGVHFSRSVIGIFILSSVALGFYWHVWEEVWSYFADLKDDVTFIRRQVERRSQHGEKPKH